MSPTGASAAGAGAFRLVVDPRPLETAGRLLAEAITRADSRRGSCRLAIPGGSALGAVAPARALLSPGVWSRVRLTWVDERCVDAAHPDSNRGAAIRAGALEGAGLVLPLRLDAETPEGAVERVRAALGAELDGGLDVSLLGMGEDGHIASLFAGRKDDGAPVRHVPDSPKPPPERLTLGRAFLGTAPTAILLATGEAKRGALERLLRGDPALPAHGLPGLVVVTDLRDLPAR